MQLNLLVTGLAALIPMIIGAIWYNPKVFGKAWMETTGLSEEQLKAGNMALIFGMCLVFSFLLSISLNFMVIHQFSFYSILQGTPGVDDPNSDVGKMVADFMSKYGHNFRTFKHGVLHGCIASIFTAMPIVGINALFERKSWKYIFIHTGFWFVCMGLMGGTICAFS